MHSEGDKCKETEPGVSINKSNSLQQSTLRYNNILEVRHEFEDVVKCLKQKNKTLGGLLLKERRKMKLGDEAQREVQGVFASHSSF